MFLVLVSAIWNLFRLFPLSVAEGAFPGRCQSILSSPSPPWPWILFGEAHSQPDSPFMDSSLSLDPPEPQELQDVLQRIFPAAAGTDVLSQNQKCGIYYLQN